VAAEAVERALGLAVTLAARLIVGLMLALTVELALSETDAHLLSSAEEDSDALPVPVPETEREAVAEDVLLARAVAALVRDARIDAVAVVESVRDADAQLLALALADVDAEPDVDGDELGEEDSRAEVESVKGGELDGGIADAAMDGNSIEADIDAVIDGDGVVLALCITDLTIALAEKRTDGELLRELRVLGDDDDESDCVREERAEALEDAEIEHEDDEDGDAVEERLGNDADADGVPLVVDESVCVAVR
jgi:hypothetical protein